MAEAGLGSPEATVQTYFYALSQGDLKRLSQCGASIGDDGMTKEQEEDQSKRAREEFAAFPGFRIAEQNILSPDEVQIGIQTSVGGEILSLRLIRKGNEWNVKQ